MSTRENALESMDRSDRNELSVAIDPLCPSAVWRPPLVDTDANEATDSRGSRGGRSPRSAHDPSAKLVVNEIRLWRSKSAQDPFAKLVANECAPLTSDIIDVRHDELVVDNLLNANDRAGAWSPFVRVEEHRAQVKTKLFPMYTKVSTMSPSEV